MSTASERKFMKLRRDDVCSICATPQPAGIQAYWIAAERRVECEQCGANGSTEPVPAEPVPDAPGRSAQTENDRRRAKRVERAEGRYGRIGRWAAEHSRGPQHERAWARGAEGEAENARRLEKRLAGTSALLLHDRRVPGKRSNIDHIAVGPSGVMVIDSKNLTGKVKVDWRGGLLTERVFDLYINGRKRTKLIEQVEAQMAVVRAALDAAGFADVRVRGALCMANAGELPFLGHPSIRGIAIDGTRHIAKLIVAAGELDAARIKAVAEALSQRFQPR
jgi:hypothetical protein